MNEVTSPRLCAFHSVAIILRLILLLSQKMSEDSDPPGPSGRTAADMAAMLRAIQEAQRKLGEEFAQFREEVKSGQEDAAEKAIKRVRRDKPHAYRRKGNEEQAVFNERVKDSIVAAQVNLEGAPSAAVEKAKKSLEKGLALLAERQKLIKLADRSEHGWGVVAEYTANELAVDSNDEEQIFEAEKAAERKAAKKKKTAAPPNPRARVQPSLSTSVVPTGGPLPRRPVPIVPVPQSYAHAVHPVRPPGPCFACGELGHIRSSCPKFPDWTSKKSYPTMGVVGSTSSVCSDDNGGDGDAVCSPSIEHEAVGVGNDCGDVDLVCDMMDVWGRSWETEAVSLQHSGQSCYDSVQGRLRRNVQYWRDVLEAPEAVLRTIESGYVLPLMSEPTPLVQSNQQSALNEAEFVNASLSELLTNRCVKLVDEVPYICSPVSVVESGSGKKRLVVNLRHLNRFLWKQKFKYEDLRTAMLLFERGDYLFSFDLKSGYHHVDIAEIHQKYLGFAWGAPTMCLQYSLLVCLLHATCSRNLSVLLSVIGEGKGLE